MCKSLVIQICKTQNGKLKCFPVDIQVVIRPDAISGQITMFFRDLPDTELANKLLELKYFNLRFSTENKEEISIANEILLKISKDDSRNLIIDATGKLENYEVKFINMGHTKKDDNLCEICFTGIIPGRDMHHTHILES